MVEYLDSLGLEELLQTEFVVADAVQYAQAAGGVPVSRDSEVADYLGSLDLEELLETEFVVSGASRYAQSSFEAPSSTSVVTADEIRSYGYQTLGDVLRSQRGFYVTNDRNYGYVGMRGFGVPGDFNTRLLFLLDGHRINDSVYNEAFVGEDALFNLDVVERIEIIRGPSSSLYGTNAFLGVINIVTKRGTGIDGLQASGGIGNDHTYEARLSYGRGIGDDGDLLVSADYYTSANDDHLYFSEYDDPSTANGVVQDLDDEGSRRLGGHVTYKNMTLSGAYVDRKKEVPTGAYGTLFGDPANETRDARGYVDLAYERSFTDEFFVFGRGYWDYWRYDGDYPYDASETDDVLRVINKDRAEGAWWGIEGYARAELGTRNTAIFGGEYRDLYKLEQENYDPGEFYLDSDEDASNWALYAQDEIAIVKDKLTLNVGVRYDEWSTSGGAWSPRAAMIYRPWQSTAVKLLYGRAFRAPDPYSLYYEDGGISTKANNDLDNETIDTYEAVLEHDFGSGFYASTSVFHYRIDDLIVQVTDPADDLLVYDNAGSVESTGVELEVGGSWANVVDGRLSYTFQDAKGDDGTLPNSPHHLVKLNLTKSFFDGWLRLGFDTQYVSRSDTIAGPDVSDYVISNITLSTDRLVENLDLSLTVRNLFDVEVYDPVSDAHEQRAIQQDGIRALFKATYTFR